MLSQKYNPKDFESEIYQNWMKLKLGSPEVQSKHQPKYIIFDFDGVLADSLECELYALQKIENLNTRQETFQFLQDKFLKLPVKSFQDKDQVEKATKHIKKICEKKIEHGFHLFQGFIYELRKLQGVKFAINTTSDQTNIDYIKKDFQGLEFEHIFTLDEGLNKTVKTQQIIEKWKAKPEDVYFMTDTVRDFLEIKEILPVENILGVDWGWHGTEILEKVFKKDNILQKYSDIHKFFPTHSILMPPPNLTGNMHAGHSFQHFLMDSLSRINRQKGNINLWYPGVDHAGIQLEGVIDKLIKKEGVSILNA